MKLVVALGARDYRLELRRGFPMTSVVEATIRPKQVPRARVIKREPERACAARPW
jgi:hypothetical protein